MVAISSAIHFAHTYRTQIRTSGSALVQETLQKQINLTCRQILAEEIPPVRETPLAEGGMRISVDNLAMNRLAGQCNTRCQMDLAPFERPVLSLPAGALTGSAYLADKGKTVTYRMQVSYEISTTYTAASYAVGINQIRYAVYLLVHAKAHVTIPTIVPSVEYTYYVPVCEMQYGADVPNVYVASEKGTNYLDLIP